jgi:hypothetical protein
VKHPHTRLAIGATSAALAIAGGMIAGPGAGGLAHAATASSVVTFTSSAADSAIVAHYTVTPSMRSAATLARTVTGGSQQRLPELLPKGRRGQASGSVASGAGSTGVTPAAGSVPPAIASFIGQQASNKTCSYFPQGCNPPDMAIAASPNLVLQGVNTQWEVLNTSGHVEGGWPVSAQRFFDVPNVTKANGSPCDVASGSQPFLSDPRAIYDPLQHRFWAAMLQVEGGLGIAPDCPLKSVYYIAVSQTNDPRGAWNVYEFDMSAGRRFAADFTQIGFNGDAVFFSANMFGLRRGFYAEVFEANKAQMEAGQANFTAEGFRNLQATGPGTGATGPFLADTVQPVMTLDNSGNAGQSGGADGLFLDTVDGPDPITGNFCSSASDACKGVILWRLSHPIAHDQGGRGPTLTGTLLPDTKPFYFPPPADEPTCNQCVDASDLRISATPVFRNNTIYAAWETGINNGSGIVPAIEWAQVAIGLSSAATTTGYFDFAGDVAASYGALMPDSHGNVLMVYERMGHNVFPEARYTERLVGQPNFADAGQLLKAGQASYRPTLCGTSALPVCRWGDYEAASFDGSGAIWVAGEYANSHTNPNKAPVFGRNWGTWIGAVPAS